MSSPISLSGLPIATSVSPGDLMLLRKGFTDYQIAASYIQAIDLTSLNPISGGKANSTDLMLISRNGSNYNIAFDQVGLMYHTNCWFYQSKAPLGWTLLNNRGDRLLAVGDSIPYNSSNGGQTGGTLGGTWQQLDVGGVANQGLTIAQIPAHAHTATIYYDSSTTSGSRRFSGTSDVGKFAVDSTALTGGSQAHNHGNNWRPSAAIGVLCQKIG